jgi:sialic acid synthase SpsE
MPQIRFAARELSLEAPTYFIADISANHDGDLGRAKALIRLAAEAGANAAKFQNFRADKIVSEYGFRAMGRQVSHQAKWKRSVTEVYKAASLPWEWTKLLKKECDDAGVDFLSTPYEFGAVDMLDAYVDVFKVGSGDITWTELLQRIASKGKPVILGTGASDMDDVERAVRVITAINPQLVLMQCNTNYTGSLENFQYIHLNVLKTYRHRFPGAILGLSDHTPGHATVLGAVALGGRVIEKHFTDDTSREGPDHGFSMTPATWRGMVDRTRELELALGSCIKSIAPNEQEAVGVQRRCLRAAQNIQAGTVLTREHIDVLRPAPQDSISPYRLQEVFHKTINTDAPLGEYLKWTMFD